MKNLHINSGFKGCLGFLRIGDVDYDLSYPGKHIGKQENIGPCEGVQGKSSTRFITATRLENPSFLVQK